MKAILFLFVGALAFSSTAQAEKDHHQCEEALSKLDAATDSQHTSDTHHQHQQAKEAKESGDYKRCADQARKALDGLKKS
ncbi:hypothetical protein [Pseudomonas sp. RIT-PI-AD]|uniref:hypothetical protein n=1 Tax=Pseudomonas sp. RIT-PI-AD TaxID=3035294 RepID=UPI0021D8AC63|nr:hypothetical protein [Pseudomonas sp. RIT-PI-AD]